MADSFTVFAKFGEQLARLNEEDRRELAYAIVMYGTLGEEVELGYVAGAVFAGMREDIDNSREARRQGSRGGRPRKAATPSPDAAETHVTQTQKPGVTQNAKPGVSETQKPGVSQNAPESGNPNQTRPDQYRPDQRLKAGEARPRFRPPTPEELRAYCDAEGLPLDRERFLAFYDSNGWKVGRNPMRDWKAAARRAAREWCRMEGGGGLDEYFG